MHLVTYSESGIKFIIKRTNILLLKIFFRSVVLKNRYWSSITVNFKKCIWHLYTSQCILLNCDSLREVVWKLLTSGSTSFASMVSSSWVSLDRSSSTSTSSYVDNSRPYNLAGVVIVVVFVEDDFCDQKFPFNFTIEYTRTYLFISITFEN